MISKDKTYKTRAGLDVRIYAVDGMSGEPVHGAIYHPGAGWSLQSWDERGSFWEGAEKSEYDLIEVKPRIKGWVNVYFSSVNKTKQEADNWLSSSPRIACIPVEFEEGEGL
jgi:hypothetical protein